jgi:hypothetical protein
MADHGDAPIVAQSLGGSLEVGVWASTWSKRFNGEVPDTAVGFEEV